MSTDVFCSAFSPSGDRFVCGTSAGNLHIVGAAETRTVSVGSGRVYALQFMSNEQVAMYDLRTHSSPCIQNSVPLICI